MWLKISVNESCNEGEMGNDENNENVNQVMKHRSVYRAARHEKQNTAIAEGSKKWLAMAAKMIEWRYLEAA